jgi:hypothetical protein
MRLHILQLSCRLFLAKHHITQVCQHPLQPRFGSLQLLAFTKDKNTVEIEEICECDSHTVHKLSQRRLTAEWLALRKSSCSRTRSKVSSDRLPSYIKAMRPVLEIFKMAEYFPDSRSKPKILSPFLVPVTYHGYAVPFLIQAHITTDTGAHSALTPVRMQV